MYASGNNPELEVSFQIVIDAILMISQAWDTVSQKTIKNCFRHAGFVESFPDMQDMDEGDDSPLNYFVNCDRERAKDYFTEEVTFDDFVCFHDQLNTEGLLEDVDLVNLTKDTTACSEVTNDVESDEDDEVQLPSVTEIRKCLLTIRTYISLNDQVDPKLMSNVVALEKSFYKNCNK
ncbi:hypothetical protein ABEB36_015319 [Hypothenemus hampei]|uniref:DDE-1 domain-containing protein n=1 Tax=Hypothenemus hampei TaxID=57062 RepID=A0ABD1E0S3_HYPHA